MLGFAIRSLVVCLSVCLALATATSAAAQTSQCTPRFGRYTATWGETSLGTFLGGDAAYSVALGSRTLWFFGDSFLTFARSPVDRTGSQLVANIVGISTCDSTTQQFDITYHWKFKEENSRLKFAPIFSPPTPSSDLEYWPGQPWVWNAKVFVPLHVVKRVPHGLGFEIEGMHLARIDNPNDMPAVWRVAYIPVFSHKGTNFGQGVAVAAGFAFLFNGTPKGTTLVRIPLAVLDQGPSAILQAVEFLNAQSAWVKGVWNAQKKWVPGYHEQSAKVIPLRADSGLSVIRLDKNKRWMATFVDFSKYPAKEVVVSFAEFLAGEWSKPTPILTLPRPLHKDDDANCYAAYVPRPFNRTPEGVSEITLGITYNCNRKWDKILTDMSLYFPFFDVRTIPYSAIPVTDPDTSVGVLTPSR